MALERNLQSDLSDKITLQYFKKQHYGLLIGMLEERSFDHTGITLKSLPKIGYIAMLDEEPIAVGFLRRVEGDVVAQIDGLTSNPCFGSIIRHYGITKVLEALVNEAKALKVQGLISFTKDQSVVIRAKSIGFNVVDYNLMSLNLID